MKATDTFGKYLGFGRTHERVAARESVEAGVLGRYTRSFGLSLAVTSLFSALLVLVKERNGAVLTWMTGATSHHWITHGVLNILAFVVIGVALAQWNSGTGVKVSTKALIAMIVGAVVISGLIIAGYYLIEG